jgi:hypothetical protein
VARIRFDPEKARECAEPEDGDYYGIGSRSARWTTIAVIGLIFTSLSPLIHLFVLLNFVVTNGVYRYLILFSETRKPDHGGLHFVTQLVGLHQGLFIYIILMSYVLIDRAGLLYGLTTMASLGYWIQAKRRFHRLRWKNIPLVWMSNVEDEVHNRQGFNYNQPGLEPEGDE